MPKYYICKKCDFKTNKYSTILKHLNRKKKCIPCCFENYSLSDEENMIESLKPIYEINKITDFQCNKCKKYFSCKKSLAYHINNNCNLEINQTTIEENIVVVKNKELNLKLNDFNEKWNTNHIEEIIKQIIFVSKNKFNNYLKEILINNENHNIVIDKNSDIAYVYNKKLNDFVAKDKDEILDEIVIKLRDQLLELIDDVNHGKYLLDETIIRRSIRDIKIDFNIYNESNKKKKMEIIDIFNENKNETVKTFISNKIKI